MSDLSGLGSRRSAVCLGVNDTVNIFSWGDGRQILIREKDGKTFVQRVDRHKTPTGPSLELK